MIEEGRAERATWWRAETEEEEETEKGRREDRPVVVIDARTATGAALVAPGVADRGRTQDA